MLLCYIILFQFWFIIIKIKFIVHITPIIPTNADNPLTIPAYVY